MPEVVLRSDTLDVQMKLGVKCIGIKTVTAAKALFQFWEEIFKITSPNHPIAGTQRCLHMLVNDGYGEVCVKKMFEVLVSNFPEKVLCDFMDDVFIQILINLRNYSDKWFIQALMDVPQSVLNNGEKDSFIANLREKPYAGYKDYYAEFFDKFYRRCKTYNSKIY